MNQIIDSLQSVTVDHETGKCSICLENFEIGNENVVKLQCEHKFDRDCITQWLKTSNSCPLCRKVMKEEEIENSTESSPAIL